jgi:hypothetical protein
MLTWIRDNPQFAALSFAAIVLTLVMTVLTLAMTRAGASVKPILWFLGFFAIVGGPQAVVHLIDGFVVRRERERQAAPSVENEATRAARPVDSRPDLSPVAWDVVFGPSADPSLITDAKHGLSALLEEASEAKLSFGREGTSALAARFSSASAAARALDRYGNFFAFANAEGSDASGWTARRHGGQGEWVHVVTAGPELYAWTGADKASVLANRERALGPIPPVTAGERPPDVSTKLVSTRLRSQVGLMVGVLSLNLVAAGLWFFKGSAWAARIDGSIAAKPWEADRLQRELMTLNQTDVPTDVTQRPDGSIEINWRYADARWFDLMSLQQMKRTQRLVLTFDEANHSVRVREYWSAFDGSAQRQNLRLDWKLATGIQFFSFEQRRIAGVQLDSGGRPTGALSTGYTFNLQALKAPIIDVVTRGGWHWQPLVWNAPQSFRWLTE